MKKRITAIDAMRGFIMILMALDHANYFISQAHSTGEYWGGAFPVYADGWHFLARWLTHLSAPGFYLLMGIGMALYAHQHEFRGESRAKITRFFIIRGLLLIAVQLFLVIRIWEFSPGGWGVDWYFGTLWALGGGMLICSLLVWQDARALLGVAGSLFVITELLTPNPAVWGQEYYLLDYIMLIPGGQVGYWVNYPVLQWLELVVFGLVVGKWIAVKGLGKEVRQRLFHAGLLMLVLFVVLRLANGFGNIRPRAGNSLIDFLNVVKYPPSMTFTLMTTGINVLLIVLFAAPKAAQLKHLIKPLVIFGREPLFFYVVHLLMYAGMGYRYAPGGTSLRFMVFFWLYGLLQLVIPCVLYNKLKRRAGGWLAKGLRYF